MLEGTAKASAIARAVGYESESHFYKAVRRLTGKTPAALHAAGRDELSGLVGKLVPGRRFPQRALRAVQ
jgi:AraC-like DNA-binding protein